MRRGGAESTVFFRLWGSGSFPFATKKIFFVSSAAAAWIPVSPWRRNRNVRREDNWITPQFELSFFYCQTEEFSFSSLLLAAPGSCNNRIPRIKKLATPWYFFLVQVPRCIVWDFFAAIKMRCRCDIAGLHFFSHGRKCNNAENARFPKQSTPVIERREKKLSIDPRSSPSFVIKLSEKWGEGDRGAREFKILNGPASIFPLLLYGKRCSRSRA